MGIFFHSCSYYSSMKKGTPVYWQKSKSEFLAMVNQLGVPTFFLTLSCADLKWDELIENIQKLSKIDKTDIDM